MNEILRIMIGLIYPVKCPGCGHIIPLNDKREVCGGCQIALTELVVDGNTCWRCGRRYDGVGMCKHCAENEYHFDQNIVVLAYEGEVRQMIHSLKFYGKKRVASFFGDIMAKSVSTECLEGIDYILPVPLHKQRLRERGYNQSELLTEAFIRARQCEKIPVVADMAFRVKPTKAQSGLGAAARRTNIKSAFKVNARYDLTGKSVLIVDDVFTTGSTISELAKELKDAGATKVIGLCLSSSFSLQY